MAAEILEWRESWVDTLVGIGSDKDPRTGDIPEEEFRADPLGCGVREWEGE